MATLARTIVETTGYNGAPGINVIHWISATGTLGSYDQALVDDFHTNLYTCIYGYRTYYTDDCVFTVKTEAVLFDSATGQAEGSVVSSETGLTFPGESTNTYASRGDCLTVRHLTGTWVNGRRLQGRTFVGPFGSNMFSAAGAASSLLLAATPDLWAPLLSLTEGLLVVWHRPTFTPGTPPVNNEDGAYGPVVGSVANSVPGSLRSRKT